MNKIITRITFIACIGILLGLNPSGNRSFAQAQWKTLFDGSSLDGWYQAGPGQFVLEPDGSMISEGGMGLFYYSEESFRDFELELEWKSNKTTANSGVFVRFPETDDPWVAVDEGYEIQIDDSRDPDHKTGSIFAISKAFRSSPLPAGEWNKFRIRVTGQRYEVWHNDVKVNDYMGNRGREGFIGLQNHDNGSRVAFRNVKVRPIEGDIHESLADLLATSEAYEPIRVLMLTATHGFRHGAAIEAQKEVMMALSQTTELQVDTTEDVSMLRQEILDNYDVLFLANSTLRIPRPEGAPEPEPTATMAEGTLANFDLKLMVPDNEIQGKVAISEAPDSLIGMVKFNIFPDPANLFGVWLDTDSLSFMWDTGGMGVATAMLDIDGDSLSGLMSLGEMQVPLSGTPSEPEPIDYDITITTPQAPLGALLTLGGASSTIAFPDGALPVNDLLLAGDSVMFHFNVEQFGDFYAKGVIKGDSIRGALGSDFGELPFEGSRQVGEPEHEGETLEPEQLEAILSFLAQGKGIAIAHAGLDALYNSPDYREMVGGGLFESHPWTQSVRITVEDPNTPATRHLREDLWVHEEIYVLDVNPRWNARVLLSLDTETVELTEASAGREGNDYPISWIRMHNGGRVFATGLGHFADTWKTPAFLEHVVQGLRMVAGRTEASFSGYRVKEVIADNVWPDDIAVDEQGDVWIAELRGKVHHYNAQSGEVRQIAHLQTTDPTNVEHGLYGIEVDPDFYGGSPYVYLYYAEPHTFINTLSRFVYEDGQIDLESEHVLLRVPTEPQCCHQGGDIEWGPDSTLYLSTGDTGMSEVRPGWKMSEEQLAAFIDKHALKDYHWARLVDSERSAQNLQDLRGKILRINRNGTIPQDNPFYGKPGVRWEIYAYGLRNPYRFKVDHETGALYIGVVGPDASFDYDEYNVSANGGENFGWPRTLGKLFYNEWTPELIPDFVPPFWEYTYEHGGRSATVGPIYRSAGQYAFGDNFQNKIFVFDWARRWIKYGELVDGTFESDQEEDVRIDVPSIQMPAKRLVNIKTFDTLQGTSPISMELGPDGSIYVAEFDGFWDAGPDAKVTRYRWIEENRAPLGEVEIRTDPNQTRLLYFDGMAIIDPDGDALEYHWSFGDGNEATAQYVSHAYDAPGEYHIVLEVTDARGASSVMKWDWKIE